MNLEDFAVKTPVNRGNSGTRKRKSSINGSTTAKRKPNFSSEENKALAIAVDRHKNVLFDKFSNSLTLERKNRIWQQVADAVNSVGGYSRCIGDIKKKYANLKSDSKMIEAKNRRSIGKTGGGSPDIIPMSQAQQIIVSSIPKAAIEGIEGGMDLYDDINSICSEEIFTEKEVSKALETQNASSPSSQYNSQEYDDTNMSPQHTVLHLSSVNGRKEFSEKTFSTNYKKIATAPAKKTTNHLLQTQIQLLERQIEVFEKINSVLERLTDIQAEKLQLLKRETVD